MKPIKSLAAAALLAIASVTGWAAEATDRGLEITREADRRNSGFVDTEARLTMRIVNKSGDENIRELTVKTLEGVEQGDKVLTTFLFPKDIRGAGFLTHTSRDAKDDQWIYLPAIKRVKKISGKNRRSPFFGSEFAFEDLASQEVEKYRYTYVAEEPCEDLQCHVIERYPLDADSGYEKLKVWMDKEHLQVRKIDYYDRNGRLLKTLIASNYKQYLDRFWRAGSMHMVNHQSGKQTFLDWEDYEFGTGLTEQALDYRSLSRPRI